MLGIIFSVIAGIAMTIQGVFNTNVSKKIGLWETNLIVQGSAFVFTIIAFMFLKNGDFAKIKSVNKIYLIGGLIGVAITYAVMKGIGDLGPTYAILIILFSQLISAAIVEFFGIFEATKLHFAWNNYVGVILMLIGIVLFKLKL